VRPIQSKVGILAVAAAFLFAMTATSYASKDSKSSIPGATTAVATDAALRDLWIEHAFWVRAVVVETIAQNDAAAGAAEKEVVANAKQIGVAIEPFYGKDASAKLFELLAGHYGAIKDYLNATIANDKAKQDVAFKSLVDNAAAISKFLSGANPNLPYDALNGLLVAHGNHHVQEILQLRAKDYAGEAKTWKAMKDHLYVIADALTDGLVKQFPKKF
jgi:hypothetical protein